MHITQVRRYEAEQAQPSIEILKKIALAFNVTSDWLIFEEDERALPDTLQLKFEAVSKMPEEDQRTAAIAGDRHSSADADPMAA